MKKLLVMMLIGTMTLSMAACGSREDNAVTTEAVPSTEVAESTEAAGSEATESTDEVQGDVAAEGWSAEMEAVRAAIVDALGDNYWPDSAMPAEYLEGTYGIKADMYEDYLAEMPMISVNVDALLIIKAKDGMVETVEEALNTYREAKIADTMQYPMNIGKIQASRIETIGNYVCFVQLGADTMEASESGDEAVIAQCQEANELAIEVIRQNLPE